GHRARLPDPAVPLVLGLDEPAEQQEVLEGEAEVTDPAVLPVRLLLLPAHRAVHLRDPAHSPQLAAGNAGDAAPREYAADHPQPGLHRADLPAVAQVPVPAGGVGGPLDVRLGPRLRDLGQ